MRFLVINTATALLTLLALPAWSMPAMNNTHVDRFKLATYQMEGAYTTTIQMARANTGANRTTLARPNDTNVFKWPDKPAYPRYYVSLALGMATPEDGDFSGYAYNLRDWDFVEDHVVYDDTMIFNAAIGILVSPNVMLEAAIDYRSVDFAKLGGG